MVEFLPNDPVNPMNYSNRTKWTITMLAAFVTLAVAFVSSAYSGGIPEIVKEFHTSEEVATLGIALYVCGFAVGPLLWAPFSEL